MKNNIRKIIGIFLLATLVQISYAYQSTVYMFPQDEEFLFNDQYWHRNIFVPNPPPVIQSFSLWDGDRWYGGCYDATPFDWRTSCIEQGRIFGGNQYAYFEVGEYEWNAVPTEFLEFDDIPVSEPVFPEGKYFLTAKVKILRRHAYWDFVDPFTYGLGIPATSVGVVLCWQIRDAITGTWSDYDSPPNKFVVRGIWHDIYFSFADWHGFPTYQWVHYTPGDAFFHTTAKYDGDFHFCYVGAQITSIGEWVWVTIDMGKAINLMVDFMEYAAARGRIQPIDAYRLRGFQIYCEAIGADMVVLIDYVNFYTTP